MRTATSAELALLASDDYAVHARVRTTDAAGVERNLAELAGHDWVTDLEWGDTIEQVSATASVTLWREEADGDTVAPLRADAALNGTGRLLDLGRPLSVDVAIVTSGATPAATDWRAVYAGRIEEIDSAASETDVSLGAQDLAARLLATTIEKEEEYGSAAGTPLQSVMRALLDRWGFASVPLVVRGDPAWSIRPYKQAAGGSLMDALRTLVQGRGWDVRFLWSGTDAAFRLTLWQPDRAATTAVHTFAAGDVLGVRRLALSLADIRNVAEVEYREPVTGTRRTIVEVNQPSIDAYGRRWMRFVEGDDSPIDTETEARTMGAAAVADLGWPNAEQEIDVRLWPLAEVADYYAFAPNAWYSTEQLAAVVSYRHRISEGERITTITTRGKPAASARDWFARGSGDGALVGIPEVSATVSYNGPTATVRLSGDSDTATIYEQESTDGGATWNAVVQVVAGREGSVQRTASTTAVRELRYYGQSSAGVAGAPVRVALDRYVSGDEIKPSAPTASVAPDATSATYAPVLVYSGVLGAGATGPLTWRRRILTGDAPADWPATWETTVLPQTEAVPALAKLPKRVEMQVRDSAGRIGEANWTVRPILPGIGGGGLVDETQNMEGGFKPFARGFHSLGDVQDDATYRRVGAGYTDTGNRLISLYRGAVNEPAINLFKRGTDTLGDVLDGGGFSRTTPNEKAGAGYGYTGLDSAGWAKLGIRRNALIGNVSARRVENTGHGVFLEVFEQDIADWLFVSAGARSIVAGAGVAGGNVLECVAQVWARAPDNIPYDPSKLYRLRARIRQTVAPTVGGSAIYIGVEGVGADGVTLVSTSGTNNTGGQHYVAANGSTLAAGGDWGEFTGWFRGYGTVTTGSGPDAPSGLNAAVRYFRPLFIVNYSGGDGTAQIDELAVDVFDEQGLLRTYKAIKPGGLAIHEIPWTRGGTEEPPTNLFKRGSDTLGDVLATPTRSFFHPSFSDTAFQPISILRGGVNEGADNLFKRGSNTMTDVADDSTYRRVGAAYTDISNRLASVYRGAAVEPADNLFKIGVNTVDQIAEGATYKRTTADEKAGAARGYAGLDGSGYATVGIRSTALFGERQVAQALGSQSGAQLNPNPDFANGITGYSVYDNNNSGGITLDLVNGQDVPNGTGNALRVSVAANAVSSPGRGGWTLYLGYDGGVSKPGYYHQGSEIYYTIRALIPSGYTIYHASNTIGNGASVTWLGSQAGTGAIQDYVLRVKIGVGGTFATTGFFYIGGPVNTVLMYWYVYLVDAVDVRQQAVIHTGAGLRGSGGERLTDAHVVTAHPDATRSGGAALTSLFQKSVDTAASVVEDSLRSFVDTTYLNARRPAYVYRATLGEPVDNLFKKDTDTFASINGLLPDIKFDATSNVVKQIGRRKQSKISGGGTVAFSSTAVLTASARFISIPDALSSQGYFNFTIPAGGISIPAWNGLYFRARVGGGAGIADVALGSNTADTLVGYFTAPYTTYAPPDPTTGLVDYLIGYRSGDNDALYLSDGRIVRLGGSILGGTSTVQEGEVGDGKIVSGRDLTASGYWDASKRPANIYKGATVESVENLFKKGTDTLDAVVPTATKAAVHPAYLRNGVSDIGFVSRNAVEDVVNLFKLSSNTLDQVAEGTTYVRTTATEKTGAARAANALDASSRLSDQRRLNQVVSANAGSLQATIPLSYAWDSTNAVYVITAGAHSVQYGFGTVSYNAATANGMADNTYYCYYLDPDFAGGSRILYADRNRLAVLRDGAYYLGKVVLPAPGSSGTGAGGGTTPV